MRSVVFGATGIVGGHIVAHLVRAGEKPVAVSRSPHPSGSVEWVTGDLMAPQSLQLPDVDRLYCTVEVGALADALPHLHLHTPSLKRVVAFTSTSIVTKIESEIEAERVLLRRLADGERRLIDCCERLGIEWTILRPTIIYAEGRDANITRLARLIGKYGALPLAGRGSGLRQPVHAEDLAIGALQAAGSEAAANKTYALPGSDTITYREMVGRIFDGLRKPRRILSVPPALWRVAFALAKPLFPKANAAMGSRMAMNMVFDDTPAKQDFGWSPRGFHPRFD